MVGVMGLTATFVAVGAVHGGLELETKGVEFPARIGQGGGGRSLWNALGV